MSSSESESDDSDKEILTPEKEKKQIKRAAMIEDKILKKYPLHYYVYQNDLKKLSKILVKKTSICLFN